MSPRILLALACCLPAPALAQHVRHADERDEKSYDPASRYREEPSYRILAPGERVYRARSGAYYCKRSDGSTGLIAGAVDGEMLGDAILPGHSRPAGPLIAEVLLRIEGQAYDRLNHEIRCR